MPITYLDDDIPQPKITYLDEPIASSPPISMTQPTQKLSYADQFLANVRAGGEAAIDLTSPSYWRQTVSNVGEGLSKIGEYVANPQLRQDVANMGFSRQDLARTFNEKFAESPGGKGLAAMNAALPVWNAVGTAVQKYGIPNIAKATGLTEDEIVAGLTIGGPAIGGAAKAVSKALPENINVPKVGALQKNTLINATNLPISGTKKGVQNLGKGIMQGGVEQIEVAIDNQKNISNNLFKQADATKTFIRPEGVQRIIDITNEASKGQTKLLSKKTLNVFKDMAEYFNKENITDKGILTNVKNTKNPFLQNVASKRNLKQGISLRDVDTFRKRLAVELNDARKNQIGGEAYKAQKQVYDAFNDALTTLDETHATNPQGVGLLKEALSGWSVVRRLDEIKEIVEEAKGSVGKEKAGLRKLAKAAKDYKWPKEQINALNQAGNYTFGQAIMGGMGKFGIDPFSINKDTAFIPSLAAGGGILGGPGVASYTLPLVGIGTVANILNKGVQRGKTQTLVDVIAKGGKKQ